MSEAEHPVDDGALVRWSTRLGPILALVLCGMAVAVLRRELADTHLRDVLAAASAIPTYRLWAAVALTGAGYGVLTLYDLLALRYVGRPLAYRRVALMSFISYVFSHNLGFAFLSGNAVRYRMLTSWGFTAGEVTRAIVFNVATFWLGAVAVGATFLVLAPMPLPPALHLVMTTTRPLGLVALGVLIAWGAMVGIRRQPLELRGFEVHVPRPALAAVQLVVALLDWIVAAAVVWAVVPPEAGVGLVQVVDAFVVAQIVGVISSVPGGIGVFESVLMILVGPQVGAAALLGALLVYRLVYYLLPLAVALVLLAGFEARQRWGRAAPLPPWTQAVVPHLLALATFGMGAILLLSGATPAVEARMHRLERFMPLPVLEVSHLAGSVAGTLLLLLARAVQRRVDVAYHVTVGLLSVGIVASLAKGLDWEEALVLGTVLVVFLPCRPFFDRHASLFADAFSRSWNLAVLAAVLGVAITVDLAYRHVEYAHDLWWHFSLAGDASRSLRALATTGIVLTVVASARLLRPTRRRGRRGPAPVDDRLRRLVAAAPSARAHLALLGDKEILYDEGDQGFVMYAVRGRSWIAMGDPIGPPETRRHLAWAFQDLADAAGGWAAFYEVGGGDLGTYLEMGLTARKLGEEAHVPLAGFSLEGSHRKALRYTVRRFARDGYTFRVAAPQETAQLLGQLEAVSTAWLRTKRVREKRFSLGRFDPTYLAGQPIALVERAGEILAFANLWCSGGRAEVSPDLMRHRDDAPPGTMEFLFTQLLLWGKAEGYERCNLGMAPLAGVQGRRRAPAWYRVGALIYRHGEQFYGFQGLRAFKNKFDPVWEPRYLVAPDGTVFARVLLDVIALVSGGVTGAVMR